MGRRWLVLVLEVAVDPRAVLEQRPEAPGPATQRVVVVRRLPQPEVAEGRVDFEGVQEHRHVHARPGFVPKLERVLELRIERVEEQPEHPVVARARWGELNEHRPKPLAEQADPLAEGGNQFEPAEVRDLAAHLHGETEVARRLLGPAAELLLLRQPVEGRVQLDRRQALRIELEELGRLRLLRVEAAPPRRVGEARGADIRPGYTRRRGHDG